jgi:hypothetical protein
MIQLLLYWIEFEIIRAVKLIKTIIISNTNTNKRVFQILAHGLEEKYSGPNTGIIIEDLR